MEFKSQICTTREQSERLLALGLKKETADMYYSPFYFENNLIDYFDAKVLGGSVREEMMAGYEEYKDYILAWSLHRLMEMAFNSLNDADADAEDEIYFIRQKNPFESMLELFEWLIKEGYFNKEYLV